MSCYTTALKGGVMDDLWLTSVAVVLSLSTFGLAQQPSPSADLYEQPGNGTVGVCESSGAAPGCCRNGRLWGEAEYLLWWTEGGSLPPLVTTGPVSSLGALAPANGTSVLLGGNSTNNSTPRS